ncbi:MAG: hypothetical protein V4792_09955 [Pseudomonadota bacterium]
MFSFPPLPPKSGYPADFTGCRPAVYLTEADVRRIVREELARATPPTAAKGQPNGNV